MMIQRPARHQPKSTGSLTFPGYTPRPLSECPVDEAAGRIVEAPESLSSFADRSVIESVAVVKSRAGQLLIASGKLQDPNFARSVILIIQDDPSGTMGLVLNRPMEMTVQEACDDVLETQCMVDAPLHQGGPCERLLTVLHTRGGYGEI